MLVSWLAAQIADIMLLSEPQYRGISLIRKGYLEDKFGVRTPTLRGVAGGVYR